DLIALAGQRDLALKCLIDEDERTRRPMLARLSLSLARSGAIESAVDLAKTSLGGNKGDVFDELVQFGCSIALATADQTALALEVALQMSDLRHRATALLTLARVYQERGCAQQSESVLSRALAAISSTHSMSLARAEAATILLALGHA